MQRYISGLEGGPEALNDLLRLAAAIKADPEATYRRKPLAGKIMGSIFLNPSLRTRASMEAAMVRLGGHMISLAPGGGSWGIEFETGAVMDGNQAEHIIEAARVLSGYVDLLGMRSFAGMQDFHLDMQDRAIQALADYATVPVLSLESAVYHPCQALADALTLHELFQGAPQGRRFALVWATHPRMCGVAVPHSALLTAARLGMEVVVAHPEGYDLHAPVVEAARALAHAAGGDVSFTDSMEQACRGAHVVYAKAWGSPLDYGQGDAGPARNRAHAAWTLGAHHMEQGDDARFMHCLPVRRNVVVTDQVIDSPASAVIQQAHNRMWAQMALAIQMVDAAR